MESSPSSTLRAPSRSNLALRLGLALGFIAAIAAFILNFYNCRTPQPRLWTVEELAAYNGTDERLPILLGILGSVFDVTKGKSHYGPGGGYHHFAGRDASRAFVSGNFSGDGLTDSLQGLTSAEVNSIVDWRKFYYERYMHVIQYIYTKHLTASLPGMALLRFVGKLVGRYYDDQGNPKKYLKGVEAKAKRGAQLLEKQKIEDAKIPSCNSRWSDQEGGKVWCDEGYPRLVKRPIDSAITGKVSQRCACFKQEELDRPGLEVYKGCDFLSNTCPV